MKFTDAQLKEIDAAYDQVFADLAAARERIAALEAERDAHQKMGAELILRNVKLQKMAEEADEQWDAEIRAGENAIARIADLEAERDEWHKVALGWNADCEPGLERERQSRALADNLAMLLRRMIWFTRRLDGDSEIKVLAAKAAQFLNDTGLGGSVLREEDRTELRKIADEINRIAPEPK